MFGSSFLKFELANMVFFNRLAKNISPVKIIIKFEQIAYSSMKPSISYITHLQLQNELILWWSPTPLGLSKITMAA
jgi:hypothetical protein